MWSNLWFFISQKSEVTSSTDQDKIWYEITCLRFMFACQKLPLITIMVSEPKKHLALLTVSSYYLIVIIVVSL